jgi:hypothetical protein
MATWLLLLTAKAIGRQRNQKEVHMKKTFAVRLLTAVFALLLLALGHLACGGSGSKSPTAPAEFGGTPTPMGAPTPTPGTGY